MYQHEKALNAKTAVRHNLVEYQDIINRFVSGRLGVSEFEMRYLRMFKEDSTLWPSAEYEILNGLFSAVDAYCENPDLRQPFSLDEEQLRAEAQAALRALALLEGSA